MGYVFWLTGLPGAGKTHLAMELYRFLDDHSLPVVRLDGDELRVALDVRNQYDQSSRLQLAKTYSRLANLLSKQNMHVVVSTVSLFNELYIFNRNSITNYFEVFLDFPVEKLLEGPRKDMYRDNTPNYLSEIIPQYPLTPDLHLRAKDESERAEWISILKNHVSKLLKFEAPGEEIEH